MTIQRVLWVDVETTGLDPAVHEVIEIGAVLCDLSGRVLRTYDKKIAPEHIETATPKALEINGYLPEAWVSSISAYSAADDLSGLAPDAHTALGGWNVAFDDGFLRALMANAGKRPGWDYHLVDVFPLAWSRARMSVKRDGMDEYRAVYGLAAEPKPHRAVNGARCAMELFNAIREAA